MDFIDCWSMGEQLPTDASTFIVKPNSPPSFETSLTKLDMMTLETRQSNLRTIADSLMIDLADWQPPMVVRSFEQALSASRANPGSAFPYYNPLGTIDPESCSLPLGGEEVDTNGELRFFPNVFVAGPCLFPRAGSANPSLTTTALSNNVSQQIAGRWK